MKKRRQLFVLLRDVELPTSKQDPFTGCYTAEYRTYPAMMAMLWPNGTPCIHAELYLADFAKDHSAGGGDGGSLRDAAAALSTLVRYCSAIERDFWMLSDRDFEKFVEYLQDEPSLANPNRRRRQSNRVARIVQVAIDFLDWLKRIGITTRTIVGPREISPQIPIEVRRVFDKRSRTFTQVLEYRYTPVSTTVQSKGPIGAETRQKLWDAVARLSTEASPDPRFRNRYATEADFLFERDYVRKRRELLLDILGATGARPGEIVELSVKENENCARSSRLVINTLKRRRHHTRSIPVNRGLAIRIDLFIKSTRKQLVERARRQRPDYQSNDRVFLSVKGAPLSAASFERDFNRIVHAAGIGDQRACMSMYRHRFITNMVALHLRAFMDKRPGHSREIMTQDDYRSILRKVMPFTGHGDVSSLLHYIDLAWDELGVFKGVDPTANLLHSLEGSLASLEGLARELLGAKQARRNELVKRIMNEIVELRGTTSAVRSSA